MERLDSDDAGFPIFLNETGHVRGGASTSLIGYRWFNGNGAWCPESSLFACPDSVYCPDLGQTISEQKNKPVESTKPKHEYVGHVTLIK